MADEQSNSVIVSSPEELVPTIREMIDQIDTSITAVTDTRVFRLNNADAVELAATITSLYSDSAPTSTTGGNNSRRGQNGGGNNFAQRFFGGGATNTAANQSSRAQAQSKVVAVGDPRTNTLLIIAAKDSMLGIAEIVGRLDSTSAKKQHVYTYSLQHAQPDTVADVLRSMLGQTPVNSQTADPLSTRRTNGATISTDDSSTSSNGRTGSR